MESASRRIAASLVSVALSKYDWQNSRVVEVRLAEQYAREQQRRIDGRQLDRLVALSRVHVEKVIEEPVVSRGTARARVLRRGPEELQRRECPGGRLGTGDVTALGADRVGGEREAHGRDARERLRGRPVGGEPVSGVGQVPEVMERALLESVEEAGGLGRVGRGRALGVVRAARREGRRDERGGELCATRHARRISLRSPGAGHR